MLSLREANILRSNLLLPKIQRDLILLWATFSIPGNFRSFFDKKKTLPDRFKAIHRVRQPTLPHVKKLLKRRSPLLLGAIANLKFLFFPIGSALKSTPFYFETILFLNKTKSFPKGHCTTRTLVERIVIYARFVLFIMKLSIFSLIKSLISFIQT